MSSVLQGRRGDGDLKGRTAASSDGGGGYGGAGGSGTQGDGKGGAGHGMRNSSTANMWAKRTQVGLCGTSCGPVWYQVGLCGHRWACVVPGGPVWYQVGLYDGYHCALCHSNYTVTIQ